MKTIYKYPLPLQFMPRGECQISMAARGKVLHVAEQNGDPCLWVEIEVDSPTALRNFCVVGTGHAIRADYPAYLGTAHCGAFVWHVFESSDDSAKGEL